MKKNIELLDKRAKFIKEEVARRHNEKVDVVVRDLSDQLFLAESTIWKDLAK